MPGQDRHPVYKNVSIEELNRLIDATNDLEEKLSIGMHYILCYGVKGQTNCSLAELVNVTKEKLLRASTDSKREFTERNGYAASATAFKGIDASTYEESFGPLFMKNPLLFMANTAKLMSISDLPEDADNDMFDMKDNANSLADYLISPKVVKEYNELQKFNRPNDLVRSVAKRELNRENASKSDILEPHKGGFFERWRKKTSPEYLQFKETFENINNPESTYFGDLDALERDTKAYLVHKIPGYDPNKLPTEAQINALSGTGKGRAKLCLNVLKAITEQRQIEMVEKAFIENGISHDMVEKTPEEIHMMYQQELYEEQKEAQKELKEHEPDPVDYQKEFMNQLNKDIAEEQISDYANDFIEKENKEKGNDSELEDEEENVIDN